MRVIGRIENTFNPCVIGYEAKLKREGDKLNKFCIFNNKTLCTECGECDTCDLNSNKKCTSCGKCLQMEGIDIKAVKIDEISEEVEEEVSKAGKLESAAQGDISEEISDSIVDDYCINNMSKDSYEENNDSWELIGDIDGLEDVLQKENTSDLTEELFPGLITLGKNKTK